LTWFFPFKGLRGLTIYRFLRLQKLHFSTNADMIATT
jgi:hypothetical protein